MPALSAAFVAVKAVGLAVLIIVPVATQRSEVPTVYCQTERS